MRVSIPLTALTLLAALATTVPAETRTWTDVYGNTIEAEMVENMHGNITLLKTDGKETDIKISGLSAADQKYVLVNSPPNIDIQVSKATDRQNEGFTVQRSDSDRDVQIQTTTSEYKITLKRSGTIPYDKPIHAEFYLIGFKKDTEEFVLLDKTVALVDFNQKGSEGKFVFNSDSVTVKNVQGGRDKGTELFGNLVVLVDEHNHVFDLRGSRSKIEEHVARIRKRDEGFSIKKVDLESADNRAK